MLNVLFVHQSADLYGSDRVLLQLVSRLDRVSYRAIVLLPMDGPLVSRLKAVGAECHVVAITRLSRATLTLRGLLALPKNLFLSIRAINQVLGGRCIDVVHSNTLAVLSGALWARLHRVPHVWHVHEIILRPKIVRRVYAFLLSWFADCIICVSRATRDNLIQDKPALADKIKVVWNGLERDASVDEVVMRAYRKQLVITNDEVLIALVGRISRLKGQRVLVDAAGILWNQGVRNLRFVFVGSTVPGQEYFLHALQQAIDISPAKKCFVLQTFTHNIWPVWDACDIAVIPSTEPESFGMVALEAMASSKPVIATNHGGVVEVVMDGDTGLLVPAGDAVALADAIRQLAADKQLRRKMGEAGMLRYQREFGLNVFTRKIVEIYTLAASKTGRNLVR